MFHVFAITVSPNSQRRELSINTYAKDAWKYYEYGRAGDGVNHNGSASVCKKKSLSAGGLHWEYQKGAETA